MGCWLGTRSQVHGDTEMWLLGIPGHLDRGSSRGPPESALVPGPSATSADFLAKWRVGFEWQLL